MLRTCSAGSDRRPCGWASARGRASRGDTAVRLRRRHEALEQVTRGLVGEAVHLVGHHLDEQLDAGVADLGQARRAPWPRIGPARAL